MADIPIIGSKVGSDGGKPAWWTISNKILKRLWHFVLFSWMFTLLWAIIGSLWFPEWWYRLLWDLRIRNGEFVLEGVGFLIDYEISLLIAICVVGIAVVVLSRLYRKLLTKILNSWKTPVICLFATIIFFLGLYGAASRRGEAVNRIEERNDRVGEPKDGDDSSVSLIEPPIVYRFLDRNRVTDLYSEFESQFTEKERTISAEHSGSVSVGAVDSKIEGGQKTTETATYKRQDLIPAQKCLELMNILKLKMKIRSYSTMDEWFNSGVQRQQQANTRLLGDAMHSAYDLAIINRGLKDSQGRDFGDTYEKLGDQFANLIKPATSEQLAEMRKMAPESLFAELSRGEGLVLVEGSFRKLANGAGFEHVFTESPRPIKFRFNSRLDPGIDAQANLQVFGIVTQKLDKNGYVTIQPIAVF